MSVTVTMSLLRETFSHPSQRPRQLRLPTPQRFLPRRNSKIPHGILFAFLNIPLKLLRPRRSLTIFIEPPHPGTKLLAHQQERMSLSRFLQGNRSKRHNHPPQRPQDRKRPPPQEIRLGTRLRLPLDVRQDEPGPGVDEGEGGVLGGEAVEGERLHGRGLLGEVGDGPVVLEAHVVFAEDGVVAGGEDAQDAGARGFLEGGEEVVQEADAGPGGEGEALFEAFGGFC